MLDKILKDEAGEGILVLEDFKETVRRAELIQEEEILVEATTLAKSNSSGVIGAITISKSGCTPFGVIQKSWVVIVLSITEMFTLAGFGLTLK